MARKKSLLKLLAVLLKLTFAFIHFFLPGIVERSMNVTTAHKPYNISSTAQALHDTLFVADLHTDSLLWKRDLLRQSTTGHLDIPRLQKGNVGLQVFSATTKSPSGLNYASNTASSDDITKLAVLSLWPPRTWNSLYERASFQLEKLDQFADESGDELFILRTRDDFQNLLQRREAGSNVVGGLFLIEGGHPFEGRLENVDRLFDQGLRIAGLTHFFDNELGGSLHGVSGEGLSDFGRQVIKRANEIGLIIDVAHSSPAMVEDVLALTTRPVILSHGGIKGACDTNRNLPDALMQKIAEQGGILGVGFWDGAVCDHSPQGVVRTIRYAIDLLGMKHVALGSDFDGTVETSFDSSELAILTQVMLDEGFSEQEIKAVMGDNVKRFLLEQLPE
ncbi:MAG: dipeptidase [Gammaproteobacteria bacterium]